MRPDVKLGIVISLVVVVVAGGYYLYRDSRDTSIPVEDNPSMLAQGPDKSKGSDEDGRKAAARPNAEKRVADRSRNAARGKTPPANRLAGGETASPNRATERNAAARPQRNTTRKVNQNRTGRNSPASDGTLRLADGKDTTDRSVRGEPGLTPSRQSGGADPSTPPGTGLPSGHAAAQPNPGAKTSARANAHGGDRHAGRTGPQGGSTGNAPNRTSQPQDSGDSASQIAVESHRLQPGDTLAGLAMAYYGSEQYVGLLLHANPQITDPTRLRVGMEIKIPAAPVGRTASAMPPASGSTAKTDSPAGHRHYTVKPGDSFYAIAASELGSSSRWEELFELNKKLVKGDPKRLQIGQVIELPE